MSCHSVTMYFVDRLCGSSDQPVAFGNALARRHIMSCPLL